MKKIGIKQIIDTAKNKSRARDTEFLYASAYIRSVEEKGLCREMLARMLDAPTLADAEGILREASSVGVSDAVCDKIVNDAYETIGEVISDTELFTFMRYPYDTNNIKTAIKCAAKKIPCEDLLFDCGTLPPEKYVKMAETNDFSELPASLSEAAASAHEAFLKTGDPQTIDLPIDKACLYSMAEAAKMTGSRFILDAVKMKIDTANVLTTLRVMRMGGETVRGTLLSALSDGGLIPAEKLISAATSETPNDEISALISELRPEFGDALSKTRLGEIERELENAYLSFVYSAKSVPFGIEIPFIYIVSSETNAKNARIILAGKRSGLDAENIRERMRIYYV